MAGKTKITLLVRKRGPYYGVRIDQDGDIEMAALFCLNDNEREEFIKILQKGDGKIELG